MTTEIKELLDALLLAFQKEAIRKIVFSRPVATLPEKIVAREVAHRAQRVLVLESALAGNTVSQKLLREEQLLCELAPLIEGYKQVNLITQLGDAEYKVSKKGKCTVLGLSALTRKLRGETPAFESAIGALDRKKNHLLRGDEPFLIALGISDAQGRVHDKRQPKFRQINRFLELLSDVYDKLPSTGKLTVYDLCCGKSYLSFAVYAYLHDMRGREVEMLGVDLKEDVVRYCEGCAAKLGYSGMHFLAGDIQTAVPRDVHPDLVISLHACDVATDIVLNTAIALNARIILATPCCHRYLNDRIAAKEVAFVTRFPQLKNKLCEAMTDAIRLARLKAAGYAVAALELIDPDDTPKNTLLRAIKTDRIDPAAEAEYDAILQFVLGDGKEDYLKGICTL